MSSLACRTLPRYLSNIQVIVERYVFKNNFEGSDNFSEETASY